MPYPGARPDFSFVEHDAACERVDPSEFAQLLVERRPILAYGSNACPSKIEWLRQRYGLPGPVIVLRARCTNLSAVWAAGRRVVDDQRPATLCALDGVVETHAVWLATDEQRAVLDVCEGRGERYDLARVHSGQVVLDDGTVLRDPLAYVGRSPARMPLLVDGRPVRCADVGQAQAMTLTGDAAATHGLDTTIVPAG